MRLIELSHPIADGMVTVPNLPSPTIDEYLTRSASRQRYAPGTEFSIGRITMVANTGTYLDTPFHRFADGADLAAVELERVTELPGLLVDASGRTARAVDADAFAGRAVRGTAVLVRTDWSRHWAGATYGNGEHPFLTRAAAEWLVEQGAVLVGIDSQNVDDTGDGARPAHTILLRAGIPIVEHLTGLDQLPASGFVFNAPPARVRGMATWPVRAYARIEE